MWAFALSLVLVTQQVAPPTAAQIQQWFEAGQYERVVQEAAQLVDPLVVYLAGSSHERLDHPEEARQAYQQLIARGETDPWALIGRSASVLVTAGDAQPTPEAMESAQLVAQQAVTMLNPAPGTAGVPAAQSTPVASARATLAFAQFQLGAVHGYKENYVEAAAAFDEAATLNPAFAYAHYYAGLAYSRIDRTDQMALRFERFLQLAPRAPEASLVQSLMRSVRGR